MGVGRFAYIRYGIRHIGIGNSSLMSGRVLTVPARQQGCPFIWYAFTFLPLTTDMGYDIRRFMIIAGLACQLSLSGGRGLCSSGRKSHGGVVPGVPIPFPNVQYFVPQIHRMSFNNILKVGGFSFLLSLQPWIDL